MCFVRLLRYVHTHLNKLCFDPMDQWGRWKFRNKKLSARKCLWTSGPMESQRRTKRTLKRRGWRWEVVLDVVNQDRFTTKLYISIVGITVRAKCKTLMGMWHHTEASGSWAISDKVSLNLMHDDCVVGIAEHGRSLNLMQIFGDWRLSICCW